MNPSFDDPVTPTLVVAGEKDPSKMSGRGPDWFTDAYTDRPGATDLLSLHDAEHSLGGIPGWGAAETTDEHPERVAVIQRLTTAYLCSAITPGDDTWARARTAFGGSADPIGRIDSKRRSVPAGTASTVPARAEKQIESAAVRRGGTRVSRPEARRRR